MRAGTGVFTRALLGALVLAFDVGIGSVRAMTAGRSISIAAHTAEHFFKDQPTWLDRRNVYIYPVDA